MSDSWPLLEREDALAAIRACVARVKAGTGAVLFIVGDSGLGKTRLLRSAVDLAGGVDVGLGRGEAMERSVPFGVLEQALSALDHDAGLAVSGEGGPVAEPTVPYFRLLRWIERRRGRPFLLALDDLHWADEDSLRVVSFLARRAAWLPIALIATLRPWPAQAEEVCAGLGRSGEAEVQRLAPLHPESVAELLAVVSGDAVKPEDAQRAWDLCAGNPLLLEQLAEGVSRGEQLPRLPAYARGAEHLLLTRFAGMDEDVWRVARAASVLGNRFMFSIAIELAGIDEPSSERIFDALHRGGLIVGDTGDWTRFVHPLFGQALYEDIAAPIRRQLHARAFSLLLERGIDGQAAEHAMRAELEGDARAIEVLERAGRGALASGAVATAAHNHAAAVRFARPRAGVGLELALIEALVANGRMTEAGAACSELLAREDLDWRDRIETLRMRGRTDYLIGAPDHGEDALREAAEIATAHDPVRAVQPLLDQSLCAWQDGGPRRALPLAARARELAARADEVVRARAEATWGHLALEAGNPAGLEATDRLARYFREPQANRAFAITELTWPWASIFQFAMNTSYAERYDDCERALSLARTMAEDAGTANALANVAIQTAALELRRGRIEQALGEARRARDLADLTPGVLPYAELAEAEALVWLGRLDEGQEVLERAKAWEDGSWYVRLRRAHVRGLRLLWLGDRAASDELLVAEELTREVGIGEPCATLWAGHAIEAHVNAGRPERAANVLDWLERCATPLRCCWPQVQLAVGRARLAWSAGDEQGARAGFERALELHRDRELPLSRLETLLAYGRFLRLSAHPADAREPLAAALRVAEYAGAGWLAHAARQELGLAGGKRRRDPRGRDELTHAERRVAELAADGLSNAQIAHRLYLSINTVQTHLKHVYRKLGITSRRELMLLASKR
jgi:DNA-binding CsgD family transcriptional regulator